MVWLLSKLTILKKGGPFSNTYNQGWMNHPNFSNKNPPPNPTIKRFLRPPLGFQGQKAFNNPQKSNLENLLENLVLTPDFSLVRLPHTKMVR